MTRLIYSFFFVVHVIPFLIIGWSTGDALPLVVALLCASSFSAGIVVASRARSARSFASQSSSDHLLCVMPSSAFRWSVVVYLALRATEIVSIVEALLTGTFTERAIALTVERYDTGGDSTPLYNCGTIAFLVVFGIAGADLGAGRVSSRWAKALVALVLAFGAFVESAALARAGVLMGGTLLVALYLFNKRHALRTLSWRALIFAYAGAATVVIAIFLYSAYFRVSNSDMVGDVLKEKAGIYTLAGYEAFARWLQRFHGSDKPLGFYTFASIYKIFGMSVEQGFYEPVTTAYGVTNIFLVWRGFVADFGEIGCMLAVAAIGYSIGRVDGRTLGPSGAWMGAIALIFILFPLISPFVYSTFAAAVILLWCVGKMCSAPGAASPRHGCGLALA